MCRNIRCLHNFEPATTDEEVREAALQFVRKVSGFREPSTRHREAFDRAVSEVAVSSKVLLDTIAQELA